MSHRSTRRRAMSIALLAALVVGTACGGDDDDAGSSAPTSAASAVETSALDTTSSATTELEAAATTEAIDGTFPVTVTHKYGDTVIEAEPQRVVTVETGKDEYPLALGVVPVGAIRSSFANFEGGLSPWALEAIGDEPMPELLETADGLPFEAISALQPDLIIGTEGITDADYDLLSGIAPTIAQSADHDDYTSPWQVQAELVGQALGRPDEMAAVIADVEQQFADAVAANPDFAGRTAVFAGDFGDGQVYVFSDYRNDILAELGFELPDGLTDSILSEGVSGELLGALDADAVLMALYASEGTTSIEGNAVLANLPMTTEGRLLLIPRTTPSLSAINFSTPLSLPVALEQFVPVLTALVDADPATEPPPLA